MAVVEKQHRVLVAEDDETTRQHVAAAVEQADRLHLVDAVGSCADARKVLEASRLDILLTDLGLPDGSGIDLIHEARLLNTEIQILVISVFGDESTVVRSVEAGADGYLLKDGTACQIAEAILELVEGGSPLSAAVARHILRRARVGLHPTAPTLPQDVPEPSGEAGRRLTPRELEVLQMLAKGFKSAEIAEILSISLHTVIAHSRSIHRKLEVSSRSAAIFEAVNLGILRLNE